MATYITFNGTALNTYGMTTANHNLTDFGQETEAHQLSDKAIGGSSVRPSKEIVISVVIEAADPATLNGYLDSIKGILNLKDDAALKVDSITDRYWMARFKGMEETEHTPTNWTGVFYFTAFDAPAYDNTATTSGPHTVDEDPEAISIVVAGNAQTYPVWTLVCDDTLTDTTVVIMNTTTGEVIAWTGSLVATDELEFDAVTQVIKLNDVEAMDGVGISYVVIPKLTPGTNSITIEGFSGTATAVYRKRYL